VEELPQGSAGAPAGDEWHLPRFRLMEPPDHRGENVRSKRIVVVPGTVEVCGHGRDEVTAMLTSVGLTELDAGDLGDGVPFVGRLERSGKQVFLLQGLRCELGVDARAPEKEQFANAKTPGGVDDVVLDREVLEKKVAGKIVVGLDAADLGCGKKHVFGTFGIEEAADLRLVGEVKFRRSSAEEICEALTLKLPPDGAAGQAVVTGNIDFGIWKHLGTSQPFFLGSLMRSKRMGWGPCATGKAASSDGVGGAGDRIVDPHVVARVGHVVAFAFAVVVGGERCAPAAREWPARRAGPTWMPDLEGDLERAEHLEPFGTPLAVLKIVSRGIRMDRSQSGRVRGRRASTSRMKWSR
jgi:hypothetical protein